MPLSMLYPVRDSLNAIFARIMPIDSSETVQSFSHDTQRNGKITVFPDPSGLPNIPACVVLYVEFIFFHGLPLGPGPGLVFWFSVVYAGVWRDPHYTRFTRCRFSELCSR